MQLKDLAIPIGPVTPECSFVTAPMFAGKTTAVNKFIEKHAVRPKRPYIIFTLTLDKRWGMDHHRSIPHDLAHMQQNGVKVGYPSVPVTTTQEAFDYIKRFVEEKQDLAAVAFEEVQMWDEDIIDLFRYLWRHGIHVIATGLNTSYRGDPWLLRKSGTPFVRRDDTEYGEVYDYDSGERHVMELANYAKHKQEFADCMYMMPSGKPCGRQARWTQRLSDGKPSRYDEPLIAIGAADASEGHSFTYEARCDLHHEVPGRPRSKFEENLNV